MAEITFQRKGELMRGVFKLLKEAPDGLQAKEVISRLESIVPPTEFEDSFFPQNQHIRRYDKIVRFSSIPMVKAGWLYKEKGTWTLTDEGLRAYEKFTDPEDFDREAVRLYREWKKDQPAEESIEEESELVATSLEEAEESSWSSIREHLVTMNPYDFQDLVAGLLRGMGLHIDWVAPMGPDRGIDIVAFSDPLGVKGNRVKVQVKRHADKKIPASEMRSFMATLGDNEIGIYVSTGGFTKDAEMEVRTQEKRKLTLIDLEKLFDLWVEYYQQIPEKQRKLLPLQAVYFLSLPD